MTERGIHVAGPQRTPRRLKGADNRIRVAQKTTSESNCSHAPIARVRSASRPGHASPPDDARSKNGTAPSAVADGLGEVQHEANDA